MIYSHRSLFVLILVTTLIAGFPKYVLAQQDKATPDEAAIAALREKAFTLLESVGTQLSTLQSAENRARIGANIVDSLWKKDEERARALLRVVQEDIRAELQKQEKRLPNEPTFAVFLKLRRDTVERIAKYDPEAALEFLKVTEPVIDEETPHYYREPEEDIELRLAKQIAANNPDMALKVARYSLKRGMSSELLMLLGKLKRKHKEHAQVLYKEIVEKLADTDFRENWEVRYFAQVLVQAFHPPDIDESTFRELVGMFVNRALAHGCANKLSDEDERAEFCQFVASTLRSVEKYDSRTARMKHWISEQDQYMSSFGFPYAEVEEVVREGDDDALEAIASKHPELRVPIYLRAVEQARLSGDVERAKKMVELTGADPETQKQMIAQLEHEKKQLTLNEETLAQIQKRLEEIPTAREKVGFLAHQANQFGAKDRNTAFKLLNQANELSDMMKPGKEQLETRLVLAMMYSAEKSDRGFAIMEATLPKLNELVDVAVKLDGYETAYLREGEWNMSANGSVGEILTRLSEGAAYFAWSDFDRAVNLASQFERPEIRLMAHLKLAQGILAGPPKRLAGYTTHFEYVRFRQND
jgi:hypothetical protein